MDPLSYIYPELVGIRVRRETAPPPSFPVACPCCGAEVAGGENTDFYPSPWMATIYACGGRYEPKPQIQNHTHVWWGSCPRGRRAAEVGLAAGTPEEIVSDLRKERGLDPEDNKETH